MRNFYSAQLSQRATLSAANVLARNFSERNFTLYWENFVFDSFRQKSLFARESLGNSGFPLQNVWARNCFGAQLYQRATFPSARLAQRATL